MLKIFSVLSCRQRSSQSQHLHRHIKHGPQPHFSKQSVNDRNIYTKYTLWHGR